MTSLIGWLLGSSAVPAGPLVWAGGGLVTAVILTVLLLTAIAVLASQREPARRPVARGTRLDLPHRSAADRPLPSAA